MKRLVIRSFAFLLLLHIVSSSTASQVTVQLPTIRVVDAQTGSSSITLGNLTEPMPAEGYPFTVNVALDGLASSLFVYQIGVRFNRTVLRCTAVWVPTDSPNFVFYNKRTVQSIPRIDNEVLGYAAIGATLVRFDDAADVSQGIFCQLNFTAIEMGVFTVDIIPTTGDPNDPYDGADTFLGRFDLSFIDFSSQNLWVSVLASVYDLAITFIAPSKTVVGQGYPALINVTVFNRGIAAEAFNVTVYANTTVIQTRNITLGIGVSSTIAFTWDTTEFVGGNYTMKAHAEPIPGETDITNNNSTDAWIFVTVPGDVTGIVPGLPDGEVDMTDIGTICNKFGTTPRASEWDSNLDINSDGLVNMRDIGIACNNFGEHLP